MPSILEASRFLNESRQFMHRLLSTSFVFAFIGVFSGLYYREFTKAFEMFDRSATQLPLVHTHFLVLGFIVLLIVSAFEQLFDLRHHAPKLFGWFYWLWTIGVVITGGMMLVKGTIAIQGLDDSSPALAGIAGLGHMTLTAGLIVLFLLLRKGLTANSTNSITSVVPESETVSRTT